MKLAAIASISALCLAACAPTHYETSWPDPHRADDRPHPQQAQNRDIEIDEDYADYDDRSDTANAAIQCAGYGRVSSGGACVPASSSAARDRRAGSW